MSVISNNLIHAYNDMSYSIVKGYAYFNGNSRIDYQLAGNALPKKFDPIVNMLTRLARPFLNPVFYNNAFFLSSIILSILFTYLLFSKTPKFKRLFTLVFSITYSLSLYFIFRVISITLSLYLIFMIPLTAYLLVKKVRPLFIGVSVLMSLSLTNYYGFFTFVLVCFWYLYDLISNKVSLKQFFKNIFLFIAPVLLGILIFFFPLLKGNLTFIDSYNIESAQKPAIERTTVYRPIEDWYNLSFRPWYFFIPPKSSIFFGDLSRNLYQKIENTNYYLADDYMEEEMAGSYMGWHFLLGLGVVSFLLLMKKFKKIEYKTFRTVYQNKEMILRSFFIIFCILLISGPPSFTIHGVEIYTPSYLLYYIIPVFRTLVRWAVVIYLFVLIINSFLVQDLYNLMRNKFQKILFILTFLSLNFVIFAIKIPVININKPPQEIAYVKEKYPESVPYAVYPKGDYYSIFWIISHEDLLINPVNFINYETGFDSNDFSKNLITEEGIQGFLEQNPKYLIYYPQNISNEDLEKITEINPNIKSREDVYEFFKSYFGDGVKVGESYVFDINN